jgi:hypothetical protein
MLISEYLNVFPRLPWRSATEKPTYGTCAMATLQGKTKWPSSLNLHSAKSIQTNFWHRTSYRKCNHKVQYFARKTEKQINQVFSDLSNETHSNCFAARRRIQEWNGMSNALMMETESTSETSVNMYQTTRSNIPKYSHHHTRRRVDLKFHQIL